MYQTSATGCSNKTTRKRFHDLETISSYVLPTRTQHQLCNPHHHLHKLTSTYYANHWNYWLWTRRQHRMSLPNSPKSTPRTTNRHQSLLKKYHRNSSTWCWSHRHKDPSSQRKSMMKRKSFSVALTEFKFNYFWIRNWILKVWNAMYHRRCPHYSHMETYCGHRQLLRPAYHWWW